MKRLRPSILVLACIFNAATFAQTCLLDNARLCTSGWIANPIDNSRNQAQCGNINCWEYDDTYRDRLEMDPNKLNYITKLKSTRNLPPDGRYIYVFRKSDNDIYLRPYDRNATDRQWAYPGNCRNPTDFGQYPCAMPGGSTGSYLHVRHSQLNGGWAPVWCAGELRIKNGMVCKANNESGHFKPKDICLSYFKSTLLNWGIAVAQGAQFGDFRSVSAESDCPNVTVKDEL